LQRKFQRFHGVAYLLRRAILLSDDAAQGVVQDRAQIKPVSAVALRKVEAVRHGFEFRLVHQYASHPGKTPRH
jgi:hypothetical protein